MDPILKIHLDAGIPHYNTQTEAAAAEALQKALSLAGSDTEVLVSSFKYLVMQGSGDSHNAVTTFLEAILQADNGLKALVDSITSKKEFLEYLKFKSLRKLIKSRLKDDPQVLKWANSALSIETSYTLHNFPVLEALCDLTGAKRQDFLRPNRLSEFNIIDLLKFMNLSPDELFSSISNTVDECLAYRPENAAKRWLSAFCCDIIRYYGSSAQAWMSEQIVTRQREPMFWENAISALLDSLSGQQQEALQLTSEQRNWMRRYRMQKMRDEMRNEYSHLMHELTHYGSGEVTIQVPMIWLQDFSSEFPSHEFRPIWSWLMSEAAEAAIYSWFHQACTDLVDDYASPEDSLTGALCAYLKSHASAYRTMLDTAWRVGHPRKQLQLDVDYVDCRRGHDVGGADVVLVLSVKAQDTYTRSSFAAFQCKKMTRESLSLSQKELIQKDHLRAFTHSSYYLLYPCETVNHSARGPVVVSARTLDGLLQARSTNTVDRQVLLSVGRGLEEYFVADLLPGWSGDERWETPETIREVVEAALRPVHLLQMTISAIPIPREQG
jgi:phage gp36-like protein